MQMAGHHLASTLQITLDLCEASLCGDPTLASQSSAPISPEISQSFMLGKETVSFTELAQIWITASSCTVGIHRIPNNLFFSISLPFHFLSSGLLFFSIQVSLFTDDLLFFFKVWAMGLSLLTSTPRRTHLLSTQMLELLVLTCFTTSIS